MTEGRVPAVVGGGPTTIGTSSILLAASSGEIRTDRLVALADRLCQVVAAGSASDWHRTAGDLDWTVRRTVGHLVDALTWNALQLASGGNRHLRIDCLPPASATPGELLEAVRAGARLLSTTIDSGGPERRSWQQFGMTDPGGLLAVGLAELLIHGEDVTRGLSLGWNPDLDLVVAVQERLMPQAVSDHDPWTSLLAAHGRTVGDATVVSAVWTWDMTPS